MLMAEPDVARLMLIEIRTMGPAGQERHRDALARFAQLLASVFDRGKARSAERAASAGMVAGAVASTLAQEVDAGRVDELKSLLPGLVFVALAPYLSPTTAVAELRRRFGE
jgi:uncharacterized protein (DUF2267 family)